jgi:GT2 family glycosyltransferase
MLTHGWIEKVLREFNKDPNLVCLSGPFIYYDLSIWTRILVNLFYGLAFATYLINRFVLRVSSLVQGGNFVIKTALERVGGFDTTIDFYGEDTDVARRLNKVGHVKFIFALPAYASGRRLAKEGAIRTGLRYSMNYIWVSFSGKPLTKKLNRRRNQTKSIEHLTKVALILHCTLRNLLAINFYHLIPSLQHCMA